MCVCVYIYIHSFLQVLAGFRFGFRAQVKVSVRVLSC